MSRGAPGVQMLDFRGAAVGGASAPASVSFGITAGAGTMLLCMAASYKGGTPSPTGADWVQISGSGVFALWRARPGVTVTPAVNTGASGSDTFAFAAVLWVFESATGNVEAAWNSGGASISLPGTIAPDYMLALVTSLAQGAAVWSLISESRGWMGGGEAFTSTATFGTFYVNDPTWGNVVMRSRFQSAYASDDNFGKVGVGPVSASSAGTGTTVLQEGWTNIYEAWGVGISIESQRYHVTINQHFCANGMSGGYNLELWSIQTYSGSIVDPDGPEFSNVAAQGFDVTRNTVVVIDTIDTFTMDAKIIINGGESTKFGRAQLAIQKDTTFDIYWRCAGSVTPPPAPAIVYGSGAWIVD